MMYLRRWVVWINTYLPCDRRKLDGFNIKLTTSRDTHSEDNQYGRLTSRRYDQHQDNNQPRRSLEVDQSNPKSTRTNSPIPYPILQPTKHNQTTMCFGRSKAEKSYQQGYQQGVSQGMANSNRMGGGSSSSGGGLMSKLMGGSRARHQAQPVTMTSSAGGMSHSGGGLMGGSSGIGGGRHTTGGVLGGGSGIGGGRHTAGAMGSGPGFGGTSGRAGGGRFGRSSGGRSRF